MKNILIAILLLIGVSVKAQTITSICITADCKDTIHLPQNWVSLNSSATSTGIVRSYLWTPPIGVSIDNPTYPWTTARGLNTVGWYVFKVTAIGDAGTASTLDSVYVAAALPPTIVTSVTVNGLTTDIYSDGHSVTHP